MTARGNRLRVTIVGINYAPEPTGIAPYTTGVATGLARRGHDVTVLTGVPHYPQWSRASRHALRSTGTVDGVTVRRLNHPVPTGASWPGRLAMESVFGAQAATSSWHKPDVVIAISPPLTATAIIAARARLTPRRPALGVVVHDLYTRGVTETGVMSGGAAKAVGLLESATLRLADSVAVIHEGFAEDLITNHGLPRDRVREIRNWTHVGAAGVDERSSFRRRHSWGADEIIVLHAGNMGHKQGLENVVAAARHAADNRAPIRFVLLGDATRRPQLQAAAAGIPTLEFLPPVSDADFPAALGAADILLVNERAGVAQMAVPSKLTSYFRAGKPVLAATDETGFTAGELAASQAGIRIPPDRPDVLVEEALGLAGNPELARELGEAGLRYCGELLSEDHAIDLYENWILYLATSRSRDTR